MRADKIEAVIYQGRSRWLYHVAIHHNSVKIPQGFALGRRAADRKAAKKLAKHVQGFADDQSAYYSIPYHASDPEDLLPLSYHDLYVTCPHFERASIFDLGYPIAIQCTRQSGWELWDLADGYERAKRVAGEFAGPDEWLVLDVDGYVILDSRLTDWSKYEDDNTAA